MLFNVNLLKSFGENVFISQSVEIKRPHLVSVGDHIAIDSGFYITTGAVIKNHVHISAHVAVIGGEKALLQMGNFTNISTGGKIICGSDEFLGEGLITAPGIPDALQDNKIIIPVIFNDFVNTGASVTILPGVTLGEGSVIGAGSLVTSDTEPWTIYFGIPAKPYKIRRKDKMIECAKRLGYEYE